MNFFPERKFEVLSLLDESTMTVPEIAGECGIAEQTARNLMNRYRKRGLVSREEDSREMLGGRGSTPYDYYITERGKERLEYLKGQK